MTTRYEFQSTLHRTQSEMHRHIADAYMTAGGLNKADDIARFFAEQTNEELADDAIENWELTDNPDFDRAELISALQAMREDDHR